MCRSADVVCQHLVASYSNPNLNPLSPKPSLLSLKGAASGRASRAGEPCARKYGSLVGFVGVIQGFYRDLLGYHRDL